MGKKINIDYKLAWMVVYKHPDSSREGSVTYLVKSKAYRAAAESAADLAKETIDSLDLDKDEVSRLQSIIDLVGKEKFEEAYQEWHYYSRDMDPSEDVLVEETYVVD